jgi:SAM-dependent methyltransferase
VRNPDAILILDGNNFSDQVAQPCSAYPTARMLQYGCGLCAPEGWLNFDASPTLRVQRIPLLGRFIPGPRFPDTVRYGDIVRGLSIPDGSCQLIYCSHVLEHLALDEFRIAIRNTFRYLAPGGIFRLVMPDLEYLAKTYLASDTPHAAHRFMEETYLGQQERPRRLHGFLRSWLGNSAHRWLWDFKAVVPELEKAGFTSMRRAFFNDSNHPQFADVEERGRWENALGVECIKPSVLPSAVGPTSQVGT